MKHCSLVALLAVVLAGVLIPAVVGAQAPTYITQWGTPGSGNGQFNNIGGVAVGGSGNVYVSDVGNYRIQKFTSSGAYVTQWGTQGNGNGQFQATHGVAVDASGHVYASDLGNNRIQVFGSLSVPTEPTTWGRIKALYR